MRKKLITTDLVGRDELFKVLALCESTSIPCLFIGEPGTGKTKTLLQYTFAPDEDQVDNPDNLDSNFFISENYNPEDVYVIQSDNATRAKEIKGFIDPEALVIDKKYSLIVPVAKAKAILIDEVDKSGSEFRSALMSLMNEKKIMNGRFQFDAQWKIFCGSCNEVPKEEEKSAFWDRWVIKYKVGKMTAAELITYYVEGSAKRRVQFSVPIPDESDLARVSLPEDKYEKFIELSYDRLSSRNLTYVPTIVKAISLIWKCSINDALIKAMQLLVSGEKAHSLSDKILTKDYKDIMNAVRSLKMSSNSAEFDKMLNDIESMVASKRKQGKLTDDEVQSITLVIIEMASEKTRLKF